MTPDGWNPYVWKLGVGDRVVRWHRRDEGVGTVIEFRPRASFPYRIEFPAGSGVDDYQIQELRPAPAEVRGETAG